MSVVINDLSIRYWAEGYIDEIDMLRQINYCVPGKSENMVGSFPIAQIRGIIAQLGQERSSVRQQALLRD